jgi:NADH:ubiquinone reductase (H+-translocating)
MRSGTNAERDWHVADQHHVVIIGGGFGGLNAAMKLRKAPVKVTLIDKRNFHLFQPLLYQVATGALSPANISGPLRAVLKNQKNTHVVMAEVVDIDVQNRRVLLTDGSVDYDTLIVATGSHHHYFGRDQWESIAPGLKTVEDAIEIRRRIFNAFEKAERSTDQEEISALLTFVIVGAGPTGVELAGALREICMHTIPEDFRHIDPTSTRVILLEMANRVLPPYEEDLSAKALESLERLGVNVRTGVKVTNITRDYVTLQHDEKEERIPVGTVLWAAGVKASALGQMVAQATNTQTDRQGRVIVEPDLTLPGHPEIMVIGDMAHYNHGTKGPLPGIAPVAVQMGKYAAKRTKNYLKRKKTLPFEYKDRGKMATIGRASAVADLMGWHMSGWIAWLAWLFVHLMNLVQFQNRVLVFIQWAWSYIGWNRAARIITEPRD